MAHSPSRRRGQPQTPSPSRPAADSDSSLGSPYAARRRRTPQAERTIVAAPPISNSHEDKQGEDKPAGPVTVQSDPLGDLDLGDLGYGFLQLGLLTLFVWEMGMDFRLLYLFQSQAFRDYVEDLPTFTGLGAPITGPAGLHTEVMFLFWHQAAGMLAGLALVFILARRLLGLCFRESTVYNFPAPNQGGPTPGPPAASAAAAAHTAAVAAQRAAKKRQQNYFMDKLLLLHLITSEWPKLPVYFSFLNRLQGMHAWCNPQDDVTIADNVLAEVFATDPTNALMLAFQPANGTLLFQQLRPAASQMAHGNPPTECLKSDVVDQIRGTIFLTCLHSIVVMLMWWLKESRRAEDFLASIGLAFAGTFVILYRPLTSAVVFAQVQHKYTSTSDMATNTYISLAVSSYGLACLTSGLCIALDSMLSLHVRMRDGIAELLCPPPPSIHPQLAAAAQQQAAMQAELLRLRKEKERLEKQKARGWTRDESSDEESEDESAKKSEVNKLRALSNDASGGRDQDGPQVTMRDRHPPIVSRRTKPLRSYWQEYTSRFSPKIGRDVGVHARTRQQSSAEAGGQEATIGGYISERQGEQGLLTESKSPTRDARGPPDQGQESDSTSTDPPQKQKVAEPQRGGVKEQRAQRLAPVLSVGLAERKKRALAARMDDNQQQPSSPPSGGQDAEISMEHQQTQPGAEHSHQVGSNELQSPSSSVAPDERQDSGVSRMLVAAAVASAGEQGVQGISQPLQSQSPGNGGTPAHGSVGAVTAEVSPSFVSPAHRWASCEIEEVEEEDCEDSYPYPLALQQPVVLQCLKGSPPAQQKPQDQHYQVPEFGQHTGQGTPAWSPAAMDTNVHKQQHVPRPPEAPTPPMPAPPPSDVVSAAATLATTAVSIVARAAHAATEVDGDDGNSGTHQHADGYSTPTRRHKHPLAGPAIIEGSSSAGKYKRSLLSRVAYGTTAGHVGGSLGFEQHHHSNTGSAVSGSLMLTGAGQDEWSYKTDDQGASVWAQHNTHAATMTRDTPHSSASREKGATSRRGFTATLSNWISSAVSMPWASGSKAGINAESNSPVGTSTSKAATSPAIQHTAALETSGAPPAWSGISGSPATPTYPVSAGTGTPAYPPPHADHMWIGSTLPDLRAGNVIYAESATDEAMQAARAHATIIVPREDGCTGPLLSHTPCAAGSTVGGVVFAPSTSDADVAHALQTATVIVPRGELDFSARSAPPIHHQQHASQDVPWGVFTAKGRALAAGYSPSQAQALHKKSLLEGLVEEGGEAVELPGTPTRAHRHGGRHAVQHRGPPGSPGVLLPRRPQSAVPSGCGQQGNSGQSSRGALAEQQLATVRPGGRPYRVTWVDNPVAAEMEMEVEDLEVGAMPPAPGVTSSASYSAPPPDITFPYASAAGAVGTQAGQTSTSPPLPVPVRLNPPPAVVPAWCLQAQQQQQQQQQLHPKHSMHQEGQVWQLYNPSRWPPLYAATTAVAWVDAPLNQLQAAPGSYHPFGSDAAAQGRAASFLAHKYALEGVLEAGSAEGGRHCDGPAPEPPAVRPPFVRGKLLGPDGKPIEPDGSPYMYWDSEEVSYRDRASHHTRGCCAKLLTVVILLVGLAAVSVTGTLMGLAQSDIGYSTVWMNSDMGAAVGQALILGLVTYLVLDGHVGSGRNVNAIRHSSS